MGSSSLMYWPFDSRWYQFVPASSDSIPFPISPGSKTFTSIEESGLNVNTAARSVEKSCLFSHSVCYSPVSILPVETNIVLHPTYTDPFDSSLSQPG